MKKNRKIILCISLLCIFILLVTFSCWFFFYPYRVLGLENDVRYYSNHVASNLTGIEEESMSVLDLFVDIVVNGEQYRGIMPGHGKTKYESPLATRYSEKKKKALKNVNVGKENQFVFVRKDIGKKLGIVEESNWQLLKGLEVYQFTESPDGDICILKMKDGYGYAFFARMSQ